MGISSIIPLKAILWYESKLLDDYEKTVSFLTKNNERFLNTTANRKLEHAFKRALKSPAYVNFLEQNKIKPKKISASKINEIVPVMDKANYIKQYSHEARCIKGAFPVAGNIDESAGSSGTPTQWIRSYKEELLLLKAGYFEYKYSYRPKKPVIVISAWSTGPWATGIKFCELVEHFALVKSVGTDKEGIKKTIETFGNEHHYIIAGYPIFLQTLFESKFPWGDYDIDVITGGDGYSAIWPKRIKNLLKPGARVVSSYGCSDIDIGIGFETPFSQDIREEAAHNEEFARAIFGELQTIPMLFQYNPAWHYIHNLPHGEFAVTHLDANVASPKIKYNVHDIGRSIPYSRMMELIKKYAPHVEIIHRHRRNLFLPFLFIAGRSDGTISFDGANVFPDHIDIILAKQFSQEVSKFKMVKKEQKSAPFHVLIELRGKIKKSASLKKQIEKTLKEKLPVLNKDFKESIKNNKRLAPVVELYAQGKGPFNISPKQIKYKFVEKSSSN